MYLEGRLGYSRTVRDDTQKNPVSKTKANKKPVSFDKEIVCLFVCLFVQKLENMLGTAVNEG